MPKISIIVPAFNEEKLIRESLGHIVASGAAFTDLGWAHEVIVCDNNSTDRTAELARAAGATVIFEPVNQIGRARNRGASVATGEWLIFVDADSFPSRELFADVAEAIQKGHYVAGGSTVRLDQGGWAAWIVLQLWHLVSIVKRWAAGSFIFCETRAFRAIGGFSLDYYAGEELDLSRRLGIEGRKTGRKLVILRRHPLLTSARKMKLYSPAEHLRMVFNAVFRTRKTLGNREECTLWYDGRR